MQQCYFHKIVKSQANKIEYEKMFYYIKTQMKQTNATTEINKISRYFILIIKLFYFYSTAGNEQFCKHYLKNQSIDRKLKLFIIENEYVNIVK